MLGYETTFHDLRSLLETTSPSQRTRLATLAGARAVGASTALRFFDLSSGAEIGLEELHRRTQADPAIRRQVFEARTTSAQGILAQTSGLPGGRR